VSELPRGTVTFLFTDIEGSTRLLDELGDEYVDALAEHRELLRAAFARHGGVEVDTQGDAFFVAFARAPDAIAAAAEAQAALRGALRVRIGIHTGEAVVTPEGYVGIEVHRAARICAAAHGGQVVLSETTRELVDTDGLRDLGMHRLKDLGAPEKLFQIGDDEFPPLRSLNATNLPSQPSPLIGRARELKELVELVRSVRVVTLVGPGGSGKTRLALQAAAEVVDDFSDGVFWVPLAAVTDPAVVEPMVAQALGAHDGVAAHIGEKRMLLLLDNLEQLLPDAAPQVSTLSESCPNLRLLSTTRAPLRIAGEREYLVEPLPEPDAVELFRDRAFNSEPEEAVHEICRRLDGLPLAVELAAARTRLLAPDGLLAALEQALPVLTSGRRDAPERQRTLRGTIEWSYDLLARTEQSLFARLGVFAGGFTVDAAVNVCGTGLDDIEALVEQSLVRRWSSGRLGMLETIGEYARERLDDSGEADGLRRRHAAYFLDVAEAANLSMEAVGRGPQRHEQVVPEQHNLRAAIDWATSADPELGLRLAIALENFWVTNDPREGARRFEALLERAADVPIELRARALRDYGGSAQMSGDLERAEHAYEESGRLFREAGDESGSATIVFRLGVSAIWRGEHRDAKRMHEESLETFRRIGDRIGELQVLGNLGAIEVEHGDPERGRELIERSAEMGREVGWAWWEATQFANLGEVALTSGHVVEGRRFAQQSLELALRMGDREMMTYALAQLTWAAADRGDVEAASALWSAIEREEATRAMPRWAQARELYAAHAPVRESSADAMTLEEAARYALSLD
jgi:predicted ATPase/class 3 adenylate cyclase